MLCSENHSLVCTITILTFFPVLCALLALKLKAVSFTRFLHLTVSSVERSSFSAWRHCHNSGGGSYGGWNPLQEPSLTSTWATSSWSFFLLAANPHITQLLLEARPYTSPQGSLWLLCVLFKQLLGLQRPGCSEYPMQWCLGPSKIKSIRRAVLEVFCNCFPDRSNFVPLLVVICLCGAFEESCAMKGVKKRWGDLLHRCFFSEQMLAQCLSHMSLGVLAEAP